MISLWIKHNKFIVTIGYTNSTFTGKQSIPFMRADPVISLRRIHDHPWLTSKYFFCSLRTCTFFIWYNRSVAQNVLLEDQQSQNR